MTKSYTQIVKQIESLKVQAEKMRRAEMDGVISRIREAISFYNLTAADLGLGDKLPRAAKVAAPSKRKSKKGGKTSAVVKYRNDQGGSWVGRGKRPQWLRDALTSGKSLDDFLVK